MIYIQATIRGVLIHGSKRLVNDVFKAAWLKAAELWHTRFRPKHFTHRGAREYGYAARSGETLSRGTKGWKRSYIGRKYAHRGDTLPLVWSSESRTASAIRRFEPKKDGVIIRLKTPRLNYRPKGGRIKMADEMRTVSRPELIEIKKVLDREIHRGLLRLGQRNRVRIEFK